MRTRFLFSASTLVIFVIVSTLVSSVSQAAPQKRNQDKEEAVIRGKAVYDRNRVESWDGNRLVVPFEEIKTSLRERVILSDPPYPAESKKWTRPQFIEWEKKFVETPTGKKFLEARKTKIDNAHSFDLKFEKDGTFVVYDVPVGVYGIQGRIDKEIGGTKYGFEVFGQIEVLKDVQAMVLPPLKVEVTPLMQSKLVAPPVNVKTHDNKQTMDLEVFGDDLLFINFWTSESPTAEQEQKLVQDMYAALKEKHKLRLLSINIDENRKKALQFIIEKKFKGSHGFTDGVDHQTIFDYGVRSFPSFWLIGKDDKILMSQYEVAAAMRIKPTLTAIVDDRILGKDTPTLAGENPEDEKEGEPTDAEKTEKKDGKDEKDEEGK